MGRCAPRWLRGRRTSGRLPRVAGGSAVAAP